MYKPTILVTIPNHDDTTRYLFAWSKPVIKLAHQEKDKITILKDKQANLKEFTNTVEKIQPSFIFFNGHGNETTITGHNNQPLVDADTNIEVLKNRIVYALSCQSAKKLGPKSIKQGTKTYMGYTEDFIFVYDTNKKKHPEKDQTAGCFLSASNQTAISLLEEKTTGQAYADSQNSFQKTIRSLLTSESKTEQSSMMRFLIWDMKHQVCLGNQDAKI
ncbi:hypothetical protein COU88_02360 [Candidatus Roizmanbacteria bacterium CG10_big_fil_rev_8_21_14_0_10_39_6]|uniref:CHAT domain-containing protein n=1 Tax=Candidatus Roizmanbacteria bacterium CG10_big_fil_rev_8_21_14_0_10_39_6 TaxID=1974853 RepID=A0A2M8KSM0_9BACT|nr:MAG: hypothetical protein COU88_02360 [Candidatus Roizmanbacteria bacterium CG10_big_fil_rev_8_21_14_0_10_39_6]